MKKTVFFNNSLFGRLNVGVGRSHRVVEELGCGLSLSAALATPWGPSRAAGGSGRGEESLNQLIGVDGVDGRRVTVSRSVCHLGVAGDISNVKSKQQITKNKTRLQQKTTQQKVMFYTNVC